MSAGYSGRIPRTRKLQPLIQSVLGLVSIDLRKHSIESVVSLSEQLPPFAGNEVQLQQVILNLVMNAIESMSSAEPRVLSIKSEITRSQWDTRLNRGYRQRN